MPKESKEAVEGADGDGALLEALAHASKMLDEIKERNALLLDFACATAARVFMLETAMGTRDSTGSDIGAGGLRFGIGGTTQHAYNAIYRRYHTLLSLPPS